MLPRYSEYNCRGGPLWPPVLTFSERAATEGRPYSCIPSRTIPEPFGGSCVSLINVYNKANDL